MDLSVRMNHIVTCAIFLVLGIALTTIGAIGLGMSALRKTEAKEIVLGGKQAVAVVTDSMHYKARHKSGRRGIGIQSEHHAAYVRFTVDGTDYEIAHPSATAAMTKGQEVLIYYDPQDPNRIASVRELDKNPSVILCLLAVAGVACLALGMHGLHGTKAHAEENPYATAAT